MAPKLVPFATGPIRDKQVISLGFYRTGSNSLQEALKILGYRDVFHSSAMATDVEKWPCLGAAADDNVPCLPSYTGRTWTREDWDRYFGPCEALTDVTPFSDSLLNAYPEAKIILIHRDFDSWRKSFLNTLVLPSSSGILSWLSGNVFEPVLGVHITKTAWKMYMGLLGVCTIEKTKNIDVMRAAYERHYANIQHRVPADQLLELDLKDLDWEPLCKFLGKDVPKDTPFPRLNETRVFRDEHKRLHWLMLQWGLLVMLGPVVGIGAMIAGGMWYTGRL